MSAAAVVSAGATRLVLAVTPSPSPSATGSAATGLGSPGITGFVVTFVLAVALIGLFLSLTRHLRIVDRRSRQREEDEESDAAAPGVEDGPAPRAPDAAGSTGGDDVGTGSDPAPDAGAGSR